MPTSSKTIVVWAVALIAAGAVRANETETCQQGPTAYDIWRSAGVQPALRNDRSEVERIYTDLSSKERAEDVIAEVGGSLRRDLWTVHLQRALRELPDLTDEQRVVVYGAIGLAASSDRGDLLETARFLERQAADAFPPAQARAIFSELGSHVDLTGLTPVGNQEHLKVLQCNCDWDSMFSCATPTEPYDCYPSSADLPCRFTQWGCGFLGLFACNGLCL